MNTRDTDITGLFFALIRCGIGKENSLPHSPTSVQWQELFDMAKKQTLAGITFAGIERLPLEQRPPKAVLLQWYTLCERIKNRNIDQNRKVSLVSQKFKAEGFNNCILKGQGIAQLYPNPLLRMPGDIDIWLEGEDKKIISYVKKLIPDCRPTYHHVDFPISKDIDIEIHYRPSWMCNPFTNRRIQRYYKETSKKQFLNITRSEEPFPTPDIAFNRIFILHHIFRHLFNEGVGIRQVLDYYFVMQQDISENDKTVFVKQLKEFGLYKFACAMTYVMQQMFSLDNTKAIVKPNEKEGRFLLREIMYAGNFGAYDTRYKSTRHGLNIAHISNIIKRSFILVAHYPSETCWNPIFKLWHSIWRRINRR